MELSIMLLGKGGFGVHSFGRVIRTAIMKENPSVSVALASDYDTVVRGGISNCHLIVSDEPCNPVVEGKPDVIIHYTASWAAVRTRDEVCYLSIPGEVTRHISENVRGYVLLGMLVARGYLPLSKEAVLAAIEEDCKAIPIQSKNRNAFEKGFCL